MRQAQNISVAHPTRLLFLLPTLGTGGSEKLVIDIVRRIDRERFAPVICTFLDGEFRKQIPELQVPFYVVHEGGQIKTKRKIVSFLNKIIRDHDIEVVNTHHTCMLLQALASCKVFNQTKLIHTEHTRLDLDDAITSGVLLLARLFMRFTDVALAISNGVAEYYETDMHIAPSKIETILNGVDTDLYKKLPNDEIRNKLRGQLKVGHSEILIGLCANLRYQKNHPLLLRAAVELVRRNVPFRMLFCGTGSPEAEDALRVQIAESKLEDRVHFLGAQLNINEWLNSCDAYCLPSYFEGLPLSLLEAMAVGLPVVATDVDGTREVIIADENGILVPSNNEAALAGALMRIIEDKNLRTRLGAAAYATSRKFTLRETVLRYEELFHRVAFGRPDSARASELERGGVLQ